VSLGRRLAGLTEDPEAFVASLLSGLERLTHPRHVATHDRVSPGMDDHRAVAAPLRRAVERPVRAALADGSSSSALSLAQRLERSEERDGRLFALCCLDRALADDPERSWQVLRRLGRRAEDRMEVDSQAGLWAAGILLEPYRWAELELLVYSARATERRLVGVTLARMPRRLPRSRHEPQGTHGPRALALVGILIGDADPLVQRSLAWAIREWTRIDPRGSESFVRDQTAIAVERADGHRARVIRDCLEAQPAPVALDLRSRLAHLRRRAHEPSTSIAARQVAAFGIPAGVADAAVARHGERSPMDRP